jgi:outer membrane biosynthesis protein TonB
VPDPRSLFRLLALTGFLLLVALGLWLLDATWPVIIAVMAAAWALAAVVEWAAWRQERYGRVAVRTEAAPRPDAAPPEAHADAPSVHDGPAPLTPPEPEPSRQVEEEALPSPPKPEPMSEPASHPSPRERPAEPERERETPTPLRAAPPARPPLRPVPQPPVQPTPPAAPPAAARAARQPGVVDLRRRQTAQARHWNLWDLERLAREELQRDPARLQDLSYLFVHLRQFASADGSLPTEFDPLVRESLGDLLEPRR